MAFVGTGGCGMSRLHLIRRTLPALLQHSINAQANGLNGTAGVSRIVGGGIRDLHSSIPLYGIKDSMRNAYDSAFRGAEDKREQKVFDAQMKFLGDESRPVDGDVYLDVLHEMRRAGGMGGVKEHLPWVQNNPALQEFKDREQMLCSMTPAERRDPGSIGISGKKRIARTSGHPLEQIETLIEQVESMRGIQEWMIARKRNGSSIPENSSELRDMLSIPGSGLKRKKSKNRFANPGLGKMASRRKGRR